jgi:hypothetical protein
MKTYKSFHPQLCRMALAVSCLICSLSLFQGAEANNANKDDTVTEPTKYVAFSADTEAYFMPGDFEHFQGEFTRQIMEVCRETNIPFTWLIIVDREHLEVRTFSKKLFPFRKDLDEFSLHAHFKWFIMDNDDDFSSFKILDRRMEWLKDAKADIEKAGLPMPLTFRYGGADSTDKYYCIEDLIYLHDELGIRNYLFSPARLPGVIGISRYEEKGNGVWIIDGDREITLLDTCIYLDEEIGTIISAVDKRLDSADYTIIGSHDYRKVVPNHLKKTIKHLNASFNIEYVTINKIGDLVRQGEIRN